MIDYDKDPRDLTRAENQEILDQRRTPVSELERRAWGDLVEGDLVQIARRRTKDGLGPAVLEVVAVLGDGTDVFPDLRRGTHVELRASEVITKKEWEQAGPQGGNYCLHKAKLVYYHGRVDG